MKYRDFFSDEEKMIFDEIVRQQNYHRECLKRLRKAYVKFLWIGRDRARKDEK